MAMDFMNSFGSRRKKIHLTTQRKLRVLLALNSKSPKCFSKNVDSDVDQQNISDVGREFMAFLQCEQFHIERLRELKKVTCGTKSYLLISKIPGEALSWFEELQTAIRSSQKLNGELKLKLNRRTKVLKQSVSPFLKQPP